MRDKGLAAVVVTVVEAHCGACTATVAGFEEGSQLICCLRCHPGQEHRCVAHDDMRVPHEVSITVEFKAGVFNDLDKLYSDPSRVSAATMLSSDGYARRLVPTIAVDDHLHRPWHCYLVHI